MTMRVQVSGGAAPQSDTLVSSSVLTRSPLNSDQFEVDGLEARSPTPTDFSNSAFQENFAEVPVSSSSMPLVQPKLVVGPPNDKYEQEADRVADQVMGIPEPVGLVPPGRAMSTPQTAPDLQRQSIESESMPDLDDEEDLVQTKPLDSPPAIRQILGAEPQLQREPLDDLDDDDDELVQMKAAGAATAIASPTLTSQLGQGGGHPLPSSTRHFMETRFGHDFGGVRVHSDNQAAQMNRGLNAQAFTHRHHVYFGQGQYQPQTHSGQKLLAHELAHVVQQTGVVNSKKRAIDKIYDSQCTQPLEQLSLVQRPTLSRSILGSIGRGLRGLGRGILSVGEDVVLGTERIIESWGVKGLDRSAEIGRENSQALQILRSVFRSGTSTGGVLYTLVSIVTVSLMTKVISEQLTDEQKERLLQPIGKNLKKGAIEKIAHILGRSLIGKKLLTKIVQRIVREIANTALYKRLARRMGVSASAKATGIGIPVGATIWFGILQRASRSSQRLRAQNPKLYSELRRRDLDMAYFLIEDHIPEIERIILDEMLQLIAHENFN